MFPCSVSAYSWRAANRFRDCLCAPSSRVMRCRIAAAPPMTLLYILSSSTLWLKKLSIDLEASLCIMAWMVGQVDVNVNLKRFYSLKKTSPPNCLFILPRNFTLILTPSISFVNPSCTCCRCLYMVRPTAEVTVHKLKRLNQALIRFCSFTTFRYFTTDKIFWLL